MSSRFLQVETITVGDDPPQANDPFAAWDKYVRFNVTSSLSGAQDVEVSAVLTWLGFNTIIFVVAMLLYELVFRVFPSVYRSNRHEGIVIKSILPLAWVPSVLRLSAVGAFYGMLVLSPIYASGGNDAHGWYHLSMANLQSGSWKLWWPCLYMCFMTFYLVFLIGEEFKHYVECRMDFLTRGDSHVHPQQRYSLLVEEIPNELRGDNALLEYFERLFPNRVHSTCIVLNAPELEALYARRDKVVRRLEKCQAVQIIAGRRPYHRVGKHKYFDVGRISRRAFDLYEDDNRLPQKGERVDSINYYAKYLTILNEKVQEKQDEMLILARVGDSRRRASEWITHSLGLNLDKSEDEGDGLMVSSNGSVSCNKGIVLVLRKLGLDFCVGGLSSFHRPFDVVVDTVVGRTLSSTGFVTFSDLATLCCAVRAPLSHEAGALTVAMAPDPRDVVWTNAHVDKAWINGQEWTANVLLGLGAVLWSVPVTAIQALANLHSLARIPGLNWVANIANSDFAAFLNGYLPVLVLLGLIAALPPFFSWIGSTYERRKTRSDIEHSTLKRFFYYQLANIYVTVTAGSILDSLAAIIEDPSQVFVILGKSVPSVVGYFVMFVLTKLLAGLPLVFLQSGTLFHRIISIALCRDRISTQRELDEAYKPLPLDLGQEYPNQLLVIVIVFTYATISPIILPVGALYFLGALIVFKKQMLLAFSQAYESGGTFFPTACNRTLVGLIAAQLTDWIHYIAQRILSATRFASFAVLHGGCDVILQTPVREPRAVLEPGESC